MAMFLHGRCWALCLMAKRDRRWGLQRRLSQASKVSSMRLTAGLLPALKSGPSRAVVHPVLVSGAEKCTHAIYGALVSRLSVWNWGMQI